MAVKGLGRHDNWKEEWHTLQNYPSVERQVIKGKEKFRYKGREDSPVFSQNPLLSKERSRTDKEVVKSNARTRMQNRQEIAKNKRINEENKRVPEGVPTKYRDPEEEDRAIFQVRQRHGVDYPTAAEFVRQGSKNYYKRAGVTLDSLPTPVQDPELYKNVARTTTGRPNTASSGYNEYAYPATGVPRTSKSTVKPREVKEPQGKPTRIKNTSPSFWANVGMRGPSTSGFSPRGGALSGREFQEERAKQAIAEEAEESSWLDWAQTQAADAAKAIGLTIRKADDAVGAAGLGVQPVVDGSERGDLTPERNTGTGKEGEAAGAVAGVGTGTGGTVEKPTGGTGGTGATGEAGVGTGKPPSGAPEEDEADKVPVPSYIWKDMSEEYWSTAESPQPEELSIFQSQGFQESAMVFGLSLLMGDNIDQALTYAGRSYARSSYKQTEQYKEFHKMGIPDQVIMNALETDDWTQLKSWYDTINETAVKIKEAEAKAIAAAGSLSEEQKAGYETIRSLFKASQTQLNMANAAYNEAASFKGRALNGAESIQLVFSYFRALDGNTAVKSEDINMLLDRMGLVGQVRDVVSRNLHSAFGDGSPSALNKGLTDQLVDALQKLASRQQYNSYQSFASLDAQADQLKLSQDVRLWAPEMRRAPGQFQHLFYKY